MLKCKFSDLFCRLPFLGQPLLALGWATILVLKWMLSNVESGGCVQVRRVEGAVGGVWGPWCWPTCTVWPAPDLTYSGRWRTIITFILQKPQKIVRKLVKPLALKCNRKIFHILWFLLPSNNFFFLFHLRYIEKKWEQLYQLFLTKNTVFNAKIHYLHFVSLHRLTLVLPPGQQWYAAQSSVYSANQDAQGIHRGISRQEQRERPPYHDHQCNY